jgi:hypothetical protein
MFKEFGKLLKVDVIDKAMGNRFNTRLVKIALRTHAMSHRAKSATPITIVELQNFLN